MMCATISCLASEKMESGTNKREVEDFAEIQLFMEE